MSRLEVSSGTHIWAERYDRAVSDIFAVQDEIIAQIVGNIVGTQGVLYQSEFEKVIETTDADFEAYDHMLRARDELAYWDNYEDAKSLLEKTVEIAPNNARVRQELAYLTVTGWVARFEDTPRPPDEVKANAIKAVRLDPGDPRAHRTAAFGYFFDHQMDLFESHAERALELAPYDAKFFTESGALIAFSGQWERGNKLVEKAFQLNQEAAAGWYHSTKFYYNYLKGEYQTALEYIR